MTGLSLLWLPILISAVFVFVASSIIHMMTPWHKGDYPKVPDEDKLINSLRPLAIPPGDYMVPGCADMKEMRTPEFAEKRSKGPVIVMTVMPSEPTMANLDLVSPRVGCDDPNHHRRLDLRVVDGRHVRLAVAAMSAEIDRGA